MGKKLRFGYGFNKSALFKKSKGAYEKIETITNWNRLAEEQNVPLK